ncbi:MAG: hypothetical protein OEY18_02305 [Candidatus Aminicenantes bacterium]|nr:hypothetical protein [Candidatus Aminicenantes bacterium]
MELERSVDEELEELLSDDIVELTAPLETEVATDPLEVSLTRGPS